MSAQPTTTTDNTAAMIEELRAEVRRLDQEVRRLAEAVRALRPAPAVTEQRAELQIPEHTAQAAAAYMAELDDLLAHMAAHPEERWVAYRGRQRLGFGTDDLALHQECLRQFPDGEFHVYGIDGSMKCPNDTVV